jgi:hypothetical protein
MLHPLTPDELAALNALIAGGRTVRDVVERVGRHARRTLRALELREPALVERATDARLGTEVWVATVEGVAARDEAAPAGR